MKKLRSPLLLPQLSPDESFPTRPFHRAFTTLDYNRLLQFIDHAGDAARAETIVDVHDAHVRRATIQHGEQRRKATEAGTVTGAGRHRNQRRGN